MVIHIPQEVIGAAWGCVAALLSATGAVFWSVKSKTIPLTWGAKTMNGQEYITPEQFDNKLKIHCVSQHQELHSKLESIFSIQNRMIDKIDDIIDKQTDILQRVSRMEGAFQADHK